MAGPAWGFQNVALNLDPFTELQDGRLVCLATDGTKQSLFVISSDGLAASVSLPLPNAVVLGQNALVGDYTTLISDSRSLWVGGYYNNGYYNEYGVAIVSSRSSFLMRIDTNNFGKVSETEFGSWGVYVLAPRAQGGCFVATDAGVAAVSTNGTAEWSYGGGGPLPLFPCRDGGLLVSGGAGFQAPSYGGSDIWLRRIDGGGHRLWDRSFGGVGYEILGSIQQTADGGFLVAGWTQGSQVSGNKGVDGDGVWLLKLNAQGFKESESVITPSPFDTLRPCPPTALIPTSFGFRAFANSWILDLAVRRVIDISATPNTGKALKLDFSYDLMNWTNIVSRFSSTVSLQDDMEVGPKFYRSVEVP
jgi:hypothetical protein